MDFRPIVPDGWSVVATDAEALRGVVDDLAGRGADASSMLLATYADLVRSGFPVLFAAVPDGGEGLLVVSELVTSESLDAAVETAAGQLTDQGVDIVTSSISIGNQPAWIMERSVPAEITAVTLRSLQVLFEQDGRLIRIEVVADPVATGAVLEVLGA